MVRDSLGRALDARSIASVVARDENVRREHEDRAIYVQSAYRDPKAATARLDELLARDGALSAARRLTAEPGLLGELRGREGFFAGAKARAERVNSVNAAAAIGPNLTRSVEVEGKAAQDYRASVETQMKADGTAIPNLSERAIVALDAVSTARTDAARSDAAKALNGAPEVKREVDAFRKAVETRFGEDGARAMARPAVAGKSFEHSSVPKVQQAALDRATKLYSSARGSEREIGRMAETERLSARQSQGARMKP